MTKIAEVRQIHIKGFRGIENLKWNPHQSMNIILGGGDCGKSTILEALGLLFSSSGNRSLTESDFWNKKSEDGFSIEAVIFVSDDFEFSTGSKIYWPWEWDGKDPILPVAEVDEVPEAQCPVFKVSVNATGDNYELSWEIVQPDGSREHFPVGLRRKIGLVALTNDNQYDRDLRLVYGSALDRLIADISLRSKIGHAISQIPLKHSLNDDAKQALNQLDNSLQNRHLPSGLDLGVTSSKGISIGSLIGLLANKGDFSLPLTSWGAGTCRMAALQISAEKHNGTRITTIDELERGLEPYRLRQLVTSLLESESQSFVTTHSPVAVSCSEGAQLWYLDAAGLGVLDREKTATHQRRDPETFLSRVSVIAEGETEVGFIDEILERLFGGNPQDAGVRVCLGQGDDQLLDLLESFNKSGIKFAGFADNDGKKPERWTQLNTAMEDRLFQWPNGCIETNILSLLPEDYLEKLFKDQDGDWDGYRLRSIATRIGIEGKSFNEIQQALEVQEKKLRDVIIEAATGSSDGIEDKSEKKSWKKHAQNWFKKADGSGGRELLLHLNNSGKWDEVEEMLRPFFNSVLSLSEKPIVEKITL